MLEDDEGIRDFVIYALNSSGLEAEGFEAPSAFWKRMGEHIPELLLLDIMLPEEDGFSVLSKLRADPATKRLPVDDYVSKPFGAMELISRIKALLRRTAADTDDIIAVGGLSICPSKHEVTAEGKAVPLTPKEYDLLLLLMKNCGKVFSRDTLLKEVWGYDFSGESRTVDVHIRTLRSKLGSCGDIVCTVRGAGYKAGEPLD